jgi:hypothetical protein
MATLNNPINAQNIVDRFADYVVASANTGIVWGTNVNPTYTEGGTVEVVTDASFGGTTSGKAIEITGSSIVPAGSLITGTNIYDTLIAETNRYTRIRKLRAVLTVTGGGGNRPLGPITSPTAGVKFDQTNVANMSTSFLQPISVSPASNYGLASGQTISSTNLEAFFDALRSQYIAKRDTVTRIDRSVCHSSCHSSCHGSRSRR